MQRDIRALVGKYRISFAFMTPVLSGVIFFADRCEDERYNAEENSLISN